MLLNYLSIAFQCLDNDLKMSCGPQIIRNNLKIT